MENLLFPNKNGFCHHLKFLKYLIKIFTVICKCWAVLHYAQLRIIFSFDMTRWLGFLVNQSSLSKSKMIRSIYQSARFFKNKADYITFTRTYVEK